MQRVRSSMVTVRPAPHPHCSKSRFSSWDEVKMRSSYTAGVDKRRLLTFCLGCSSFWLQSSASVTADFHEWVLFCFVLLKKKKTLMITSLCVGEEIVHVFAAEVWWRAIQAERQLSRLCHSSQLFCLKTGRINLHFIYCASRCLLPLYLYVNSITWMLLTITHCLSVTLLSFIF